MRKFKNLFALLLVFTLSISLVACSTNNSSKPQDTTQSSNETVENQFPLKIVDFLEREVTLEDEPERIISLAPSTTELLYALGAGNKVVGVTDYDNYPPEVEDVEKVGDFKGPNVEAITAQKPDLIFASNLSGQEEMESLENMGVPVIMLEAKNINQIYESIKIIGQITDNVEKGEETIKDMETKIKEINDKVKELPETDVFYLVSFDGNWTAGKGTFIDELISLAGGKNIAGDVDGWVQYSMEKLVEKNPNVIITSPHAGDLEDIENTVGYKDTEAVKNENVFVISNDDIIARASNRIVLGLEEIAEFLHPEVFK
ncbi:ABC transporter substrate-binding protein [Clostridium sp. Cult2]|uniref:ABC transporter substrate-binding protein n=1 Tax=Clostridium sp. Cult2 TaxID=2079003 RepID=UPI001F34F497|nr:ABC transporter substrate-binding protein [Clostridium sp. Cult2]MCF6466761.1 ABC transporter substrate-binding protein [Clostridium sp. Cult2]